MYNYGFGYDELGRVVSRANPLGEFTLDYYEETARPTHVYYPNGQLQQFQYYDFHPHYIANIWNQRPAPLSDLSSFDYQRDVELRLFDKLESSPALHHVAVHDAADQLLHNGPPGPLINQDHWTYDDAGNRVTEKLAGIPITTFGHDEVNQLETVDSNSTPDRTLSYDANGSCVSDAPENAAPTEYVWDAEDRLIVIKTGPRRTSFQYDALGRRIAMTENMNGGGPPVVRRFAWCGARLCAELEPVTMTPTKLLYPEGEYTPGVPGTKRFYSRDDLGSIRYMTDENAAVKAYYRYDPWGRENLYAGTEDAAFGYAGYHAFRGADRVPDLYLTWYRAYDPTIGRWLSRDPIGEMGGVNLYSYVENRPLNSLDELGLAPKDKWYGYNDVIFRRWVHRQHKTWLDNGTKEDITKAHEEWVRLGKPGPESTGSCADPAPSSEPAPAASPTPSSDPNHNSIPSPYPHPFMIVPIPIPFYFPLLLLPGLTPSLVGAAAAA